MNPLRQILFCLTGAMFCSLSLQAQSTTNAPKAVVTKSPVALFRELLSMSPRERQAAISVRPPDNQKRILEKLSEYEILPGELREQRLRETELRWYLRPLMEEPRTNRAARLAQIPEEERALVEERLNAWDLVPGQLQQQWINDDMVADYLASEPDQRDAILSSVSPERRAELEKGLGRWQAMAREQRQKALAGFYRIFELPADEQQKTLETAPDASLAERQEMKKTLDAYKNLSPAQRERCIHSFEKFAAMNVAERNQFLKNVERWNEMTPEERQKWRDLVNTAPIMPPMPEALPRKLPSRSKRLIPQSALTAVATK
jgi:hypothetical protein